MNKILILLVLVLFFINFIQQKENFVNKKDVKKIKTNNNKLTKLLNKYNLFFQYPARTEEICNIQNKHKTNYLGIPWATIIDKNMLPVMSKEFKKINIQGDNISSCQHISYKRIIPLAKQLNIKKLYISHKEKGLDKIDGIELKPIPIYAVNFEEPDRNRIFRNKDFVNIKRDYLFSFIGAVNLPVYMSNIRSNIYKYRNNYKSKKILEDTKSWHYQNRVYIEQVKNKELPKDKEEKDKKNTDNFNKKLLKSRYSLCPSGSGPNSIRFWESLAVGSIPVLLADTLELPAHNLWNEAIVVVDEKNYKNIEKILLSISKEKENKMRENCLKIYNDIRLNFHRS
jgi:hypothetical protein